MAAYKVMLYLKVANTYAAKIIRAKKGV